MSSWLDTVKKTFKEGRAKNASYKFKDALKDAKKVYNKGADAVVGVAKKTRRTFRKTGKKIRSRFTKRTSKYRGKHGKSRKHRKMKGGVDCNVACATSDNRKQCMKDCEDSPF